jgi:uncharacterized damage-inducible protein DinB
MHARIAELLSYVEAQRTVLFGVVALIPETLRDRRPDPAVWSVAEVLEHLHRVERGIARLIARSLERAGSGAIEVEHEDGSVLGSLDALGLLDRSRSLSAPEPVMPRGELTALQAMAALTESRTALVSALKSGDGLALGRITHHHPLLGQLNLYQWVLFVGQHEARHAGQLRDVVRRLAREPEQHRLKG